MGLKATEHEIIYEKMKRNSCIEIKNLKPEAVDDRRK